MLNFDSSTGLYADEVSDVRESIAQGFKDAFKNDDGLELNTEPETPAGQLVDVLTNEIVAKDSELLYLANMFNPKTSEGVWQEALGQIYFISRKVAQPTYVTCQLTGIPDTVIPYGAVVQTSDDNETQLICNASVAIGDDGTAETTFRTPETGEVEIAANTVTRIVTVVAGWDTVNNEEAGATGRLVETQQEFEARRYASVAKNAHGSVASILGTLNNINDILDCAVFENVGDDPVVMYGVEVGGHSIAACVYGGEDEDIAEAIYTKKDAGCGTSGNYTVTYTDGGTDYTYNIYRPDTVTFAVKIVIANASELAETTIEELKEVIVSDFLGESEASGNARVGLASTVYASRFYQSAMSIEGMEELDNIQISLDGGDFGNSVTIDADQEPVMTVDDVTVEDS